MIRFLLVMLLLGLSQPALAQDAPEDSLLHHSVVQLRHAAGK